MSTSAGGQSFDGKMTWYRAADGRFRVDFEASQGGQAIESTTIVTPEDSYLCTDAAGQQSCLKFGSGSALPFPDLSAPVVSQVEAISALGAFGETSSRTIAGFDATCVTFDEGSVSGTACISDGGVLLLMETSSAAGTTRLEATDFESGVSDDDFEPPYDVTSFPG